MEVFVVLKEWGYDGGSSVQGVFREPQDAQDFIDSQDKDGYYWFEVEKHIIE